MNSNDLAQFILQKNIQAEIIHLPVQTLTVAAAAEALKVKEAQIIKSVLFLADGRPILVIANGTVKIHRKRLADSIDISRRRVKMASAEQVSQITGYEVGAVPPFGHTEKLDTLIDQAVFDETSVYGGGGERDALMHLTTEELRQVIQAQIVDIADH